MDMKKLISILLTVTMLCGTVVTVFAADAPSKEYPQKFYDVPKDHWAFSYIAELADRGVIAGYEDGSFKPNSTVTRAEWAKIMVGAAGIPTNDNNVYFSDMQNHWAIPYVNAAKDYLTAYADNTYRPSQAAVREDVTMAMVKLKGYDLSNVDYSYLNFTDTDSISNNIKQYVAVAVEKGLISGFEDNTFRGQATITRAEAATLLWRAFQYGNDNKVVDTSGSGIQNSGATLPSNETGISTPTPTVQGNNGTVSSNNGAVSEPTPTIEPTLEPTEKPYKVDTLVKADVTAYDNKRSGEHWLMMTSDNNGTVYYVENNKIFSLTADGNVKEVLDIDSLTEANDFDSYKFHLKDICCGNDGALYVYGYHDKDVVNNSVHERIYQVTDSNIEVAFDNKDGGIIRPMFVMDDVYVGWYMHSNVILKNSVADLANLSSGDGIQAVESNNDVIFSTSEGIYKYDYNTTTKIANSTNNVGLSNTSYVIAKYNEFIIRNYDGTNEIRINKDDYEIKDKKSFNTSSVADKIFLTSNNNIIFYDTTAKSFRMISKN